VFSAQIFQENTFLKTKPNFSLTGKCFLLTNFTNNKQTQENLKSDLSKKMNFKKSYIKLELRAVRSSLKLTGKLGLITVGIEGCP